MIGQPDDTPLRVRIDGFEVIDADCDQAPTGDEKPWPVAALRVRLDGGEQIDATPAGEPEVVIRVRCDPAATPAEVEAYADRLRAAVEGIPAPGQQFPVRIVTSSRSG